MRKIAQDLWNRLEKKYEMQMKLQQEKRRLDYRNKLAQMDQKYQINLQRKQQLMEEEYRDRAGDLKRKEQNLRIQMAEEKAALERGGQSQRRDLLSRIRELETRTAGLQHLENDFQRQVELEKGRLREEREEMARREAELRRKDLELDSRVHGATEAARRDSELLFGEKLREWMEKERRLVEELERLKESLRDLEARKDAGKERSLKIKELEKDLAGCLGDLEKEKERNMVLEAKLKERADYGRLKSELEKARWEANHRQGGEKLQAMEKELTGLKTQRNQDLKDFQDRIEQEQNRFGNLMEHFKLQGQHLKDVNKELVRLRTRMDPFAVSASKLSKPKRAIATRFELSSTRSGLSESEEISNESTPDYLKDAKLRLQQLDMESKNLEKSLKAYQMAKENRGSSNRRLTFEGIPDGKNSSEESEMILEEKTPRKTKSRDRAPKPQEILKEETKKKPPPVENSEEEDEEAWSVALQEDVKSPVVGEKRAPALEQKIPEETKSRDEGKALAQSQNEAKRKEEEEKEAWLARLKAREEERKKKDEQLRIQEEEELRRLEETTEEKEEDKGQQEPKIDPVMQKYMQMVIDQRQKEPEKRQRPKEQVLDPKIDPPSIEKGSDEEFW